VNIDNIASLLLAQQEKSPSPTDVGFELAIWKWVVIIAAGAFAMIFVVKRIGDIVAKKRTDRMIESVVGTGESHKNTEWVDDDDGEDEEEKPTAP
jgi:hypothetical protein